MVLLTFMSLLPRHLFLLHYPSMMIEMIKVVTALFLSVHYKPDISCCGLGLCSDPSQATRGRPPKWKHQDLDSVAKNHVAKWPRGRPPKKRKVSQQIVSDLPSAPPAPIPQGMPSSLCHGGYASFHLAVKWGRGRPPKWRWAQRPPASIRTTYIGWWAYYQHPDPGTTKHSACTPME